MGVSAEATTFNLSDIKITGYEQNESMMENGATDSDFNFTRLDDAGFTMESEEFYGWVDVYEDGAWLGGCWYDGEGNEINKDNDVTFNVGEAFWFTAPIAENGEKYTFVNAGQVNPNDLVYTLRDSGNVVGNPNPAVVKLSTISVNGYQTNQSMMENGATDSDFNFTFLDNAGFTMETEAFYGWVDVYEEDEWLGGCWYDGEGNEINEENDVELKIGEGIWFTAPIAEDGEVYTLEFPSAL